jgi:hypothetical protein
VFNPFDHPLGGVDPTFFVMAFVCYRPGASLLGHLDLARSRRAMLVISIWVLTWVTVEFEGGPLGPNLIWGMPFVCAAHSQQVSPWL